MFEYKLRSNSFFSFLYFWQPKPLLTSIEIQGPYITFYGRKTVGEELHIVLKELKGRVIHGDDIEHGTVHDNREMPLFWSMKFPHVHYQLPHKSMQQGIVAMITAIFQRENPAVRKQDHEALLAEIEKQRLDAGDAELPSFVRQSLAQIDTTSPFFPSQNRQQLIQDILSKYGEYCKKPSNDRCRELIQVYILGAFRPIAHLLYMEKEEAEKADPRFKTIPPLVEPLGTIRECLETARKEPLNTDVLRQIQALIPQVDVDALVALENPDDNTFTEGTSLKERLAFVLTYVEQRLIAIEQLKKIQPFSVASLFNRIGKIICAVFSCGYFRPKNS